AGVVRAGVNLAALVLSGAFGFLAGQAAGALLGGADTPAGFLAGLAIGLVFAIGLFAVLWLAGLLLFKRTAQQSGVARLLWGAGGSLLGLLTALVILWGGISLIRAFGAMGAGAERAAAEAHRPPPPAARAFVTLRESLEMGPVGSAAKAADPVPADLYELIEALMRLTSSQEAMLRFLEDPSVQAVVKHPRMAALLTDPDVVEAARKRNFPALLTSRSLHAAIEDPSLAAAIRKIDLRAALNSALAPAQTPHP
ncbi:MAG: hypothetical protein N2322_07320, partial [Terrimicrobiaceae bacterium]|nr:hypothetical protein [Terrimicrobiaceae bacterium]